MPLINCKVELNLKSTRYCALSAADAEINDNDDNIVFTIKLLSKVSCCNFIRKRQ